MTVAVLDYGMGNLRSVVNAMESLEAPVNLAATPEAVDADDLIIIPGVGAFGDGETPRARRVLRPVRLRRTGRDGPAHRPRVPLGQQTDRSRGRHLPDVVHRDRVTRVSTGAPNPRA